MNFNKLESVELSYTDLQKLLGKKFKFIKYPQLETVKDINHILKNSNDFFVLYFETSSPVQGHYQLVFRNGNDYHFWDSYGLFPSGDKKYIEKSILIKLNEFKPYLLNLINASISNGGNWDYNTIDYQSWKGDTSTCGRHVVSRAFHINLAEPDYYGYLLKIMKENNIATFDEAVVFVTYSIIHK